MVLHGHQRDDDYAWLRDRDDPAVIAHLEAENAYTDAVMHHTVALQETLFTEFKSRIQETDLSVGVRKGPWSYLTRTVEGSQYAIHTRRPRELEGDPGAEQILLDENVLADGHEYFALGTFEPSADHNWIAWATDTDGSEQYLLRFRDTRTGEDAADEITGTAPGVAWSEDGAAVFYCTLDEMMRPHQLWRHLLGTDPGTDVLMFDEPDDRFYLGVGTTATEEFIVLTLGSQVTTEVHVLRSNQASLTDAVFSVVEPRRQDIEYGLDHHRGEDGSERFFIVSTFRG